MCVAVSWEVFCGGGDLARSQAVADRLDEVGDFGGIWVASVNISLVNF